MISKWIDLQNFAEKYHPDTVITNRTVNILNDNVVAHFRKISRHQQKQQTLDKFTLTRRTTPDQISPEPKRQGIVVEENKERDFPEVIMEGDSTSKQLLAPLSIMSYVLRIDYCNSLLFGSTHDVTSHLQRIQNYAARVILRLPMSSSITIHLKSLHWLPVKVRSTYKIACLCYHCHSSTAPSCVTDMLHKKPLHTRNTRSSSYTMPLLNRPAHSKATLGDRSFSFPSSSVWNSIPNVFGCAPSLSSFKSRLKTYLFRSVYKD